MRPPGPVAEFADAISRELAFDAALARRLRAEFEDHVLEALAGRAEPETDELQRELIRAFGDPHEFARQFVPLSLLSFARRVTAVMAMAVTGIFFAMEARIAWYQWVDWQASDNLRAASAIGVPIDRFVFALALVFALAALACMTTRRAPARFHVAYGRTIGRCLKLSMMAALALLAAVTTELILSGIRFAEADPGLSMVVPAFSLVLEVVIVAGCTAYTSVIMRRLSLALRLAGQG
jgi:hypothetical protein